MVRIQPLADPNVVYNFHFYTPHTFTHQGATWGWEPWQHFHDLPYPSSPEAVALILPQIDADVRDYVRSYGDERWDRSRLEEHIKPVVDWAEQHGARLTLGWCGCVMRVSCSSSMRLAGRCGIMRAASVSSTRMVRGVRLMTGRWGRLV